MKGHITSVKESYPEAPHWEIIILPKTNIYTELKLGWVFLWYPKDPIQQRYNCLIKTIVSDDWPQDIQLFTYWSPEGDIDEGNCVSELTIGDIEYEYDTDIKIQEIQ